MSDALGTSPCPVLVAMRHQDFRRAAHNVDSALLRRHDDVIRRAAKAVWWKFRPLLAQQGRDEDDVLQMARIWAVNALGAGWQVGSSQGQAHAPSEVEVPRIVFRHVLQRGQEWALQLKRERERGSPGREVEQELGVSAFAADARGHLGEVTQRQGTYLQQGASKRRRRAGAKRCVLAGLATVVAERGHDDMAEMVQATVDSPAACPDSRAAATRLLRRVRACAAEKLCPVCVEAAKEAKGKPKFSAGKALTATAPQIDSLPMLRSFLARIAELDGGVAVRPGAKAESGARYLAYNRHALVLLGLLALRDGVSTPTPAGRRLLALAEGSPEERALLLACALGASGLSRWRWFLDLPAIQPADRERLVAQFVAEGLSQSTAERRARTLGSWFRYLKGDAMMCQEHA